MRAADWIIGDKGGNQYDSDSLMEACRDADSIAEREAEKEREYQHCWSLGNQYGDARDSVAADRKEALKLIAEIKAARNLDLFRETADSSVCRALRAAVSRLRSDIADARETMATILNDNVFRGDHKSAFMDGASMDAAEFARVTG